MGIHLYDIVVYEAGDGGRVDTRLYDIVVYEAGDGGVWVVLTSMTLLSMRLGMG